MENILWWDPRHSLETKLIDPSCLDIEMSKQESAFICGLLRSKRPNKILEIGVSAGGTSAVILKALDMLNLPSQLHSIDVTAEWARDQNKTTGYVVGEYVPELMKRWDLHLGNVASIPLKTIGNGIDFCVIDTMHILPGEILDFLVAFPYLQTGAVVLLHDTARHYDKPYDTNFLRYATSLLFSCVVADKLTLVSIDRQEGLANISAFIITEDTKKYIANVFSALTISWAYMLPPSIIDHYLAGMSPFYSEELMEFVKRIINMNLMMRGMNFRYPTDANKKILLNTTGEEIKV